MKHIKEVDCLVNVANVKLIENLQKHIAEVYKDARTSFENDLKTKKLSESQLQIYYDTIKDTFSQYSNLNEMKVNL